MRSYVLPSFWKRFEALPPDIQRLVRKNYGIWSQDPFHNGLEFKKLWNHKPFWSARCGIDHRVVGYMKDGAIYWFFVGTHADYDRLLKQL
jgi:Txe/YoeB family toxin of Txe-Axe toxin-antitoxin module